MTDGHEQTRAVIDESSAEFSAGMIFRTTAWDTATGRATGGHAYVGPTESRTSVQVVESGNVNIGLGQTFASATGAPSEAVIDPVNFSVTANATLDGELILSFDFPAVQLGDSFELIRLDPGGMFTGFFDDTTVMGLPAGMTAEAETVAESLMATVISAPLTADFDMDGDGDSDGSDFLAWQQQIGLPTR